MLREINARFAGRCSICDIPVVPGGKVWFDDVAKTVRCHSHTTVTADQPAAGGGAAGDVGPIAAPDPIPARSALGRVLKLRLPGVCSVCQTALAAGVTARWDATSKTVSCLDHDDRSLAVVEPIADAPVPRAPLTLAAPAPPAVTAVVKATTCAVCSIPLARGAAAVRVDAARWLCVSCGGTDGLVDVGTAGGSARAEHLARRAHRDEDVRSKHRYLGGLIVALNPDDVAGAKWGKGAVGEERLGAALTRVAGEVGGFALHDRAIPGSVANLDHLVVVPAGVFVVDSKRWSGRIEIRDVGGWFKTDLRVFVGGRNRSAVIESATKQAARVNVALRAAGVDVAVSCHAAMCFVDGEWPLLGASDHMIRGVHVCPPRTLYRHLQAPGVLTGDDCRRLAQILAGAFPVKKT